MAQATFKDNEVLGYDGECCTTYEVLQILSISLTDKTHLRDLFDKTNFNDVKDRFGSLIPGLFD